MSFTKRKNSFLNCNWRFKILKSESIFRIKNQNRLVINPRQPHRSERFWILKRGRYSTKTGPSFHQTRMWYSQTSQLGSLGSSEGEKGNKKKQMTNSIFNIVFLLNRTMKKHSTYIPWLNTFTKFFIDHNTNRHNMIRWTLKTRKDENSLFCFIFSYMNEHIE